MKTKKKVRLAIEAIDEKLQRLAVQANLFDNYHLDNAHTRSASEKRKDLLEVVAWLEDLAE